MNILEVVNLSKRYEGFRLGEINLTLPQGYLMGVVGSRGAGKTTFLKALLNLVRPDTGVVRIFEQETREQSVQGLPPTIGEKVGFTLGGVAPYASRRLSQITATTQGFYPKWDEGVYQSWMARFGLDEKAKLHQLSPADQVKYVLATSLARHCGLIVLDDPTRGLEKDESTAMLDLFRELISAEKCSLVFTTSQIMDVETCADYVAYLRRGELIAYTSVDEFSRSFLLVKGRLRFLTDELESALHGIRVTEKGFTGMIKTKDEAFTTGCQIKEPRLEQIMVFLERPESRPRRAHEEAE